MSVRALMVLAALAAAYPAWGGTYSVTFNESQSSPNMIFNLPSSGADQIDVLQVNCGGGGTNNAECSGELYSYSSFFGYFPYFVGYVDPVTQFATDVAIWNDQDGSFIDFQFDVYAPNTTPCPYGSCQDRPLGSQFLFLSRTNLAGDTLNIFIGTPAPSVPEPATPVLIFAGLAAAAFRFRRRRHTDKPGTLAA